MRTYGYFSPDAVSFRDYMSAQGGRAVSNETNGLTVSLVSIQLPISLPSINCFLEQSTVLLLLSKQMTRMWTLN